MKFVLALCVVCALCALYVSYRKEKQTKETYRGLSTGKVYASVVGGDRAERGEFPYFVSLFDDSGEGCGGSLIAPQIVLTAAHCAADKGNTVRVGLRSLTDMSGVETRTVVKVLRHPKFSQDDSDLPTHRSSDLCLLLLDKPCTHNKPIPLLAGKLAIGEEVRVVGRGVRRDLSKKGLAAMKEMMMHKPDTIDPAVLDLIRYPIPSAKVMHTLMYIQNCGKATTPDVVCAFRQQKGAHSACSGDSGGPLVWENGSRRALVAVVHSSTEKVALCGKQGFPGAYVAVHPHRTWIDSTIRAWQAKGLVAATATWVQRAS